MNAYAIFAVNEHLEYLIDEVRSEPQRERWQAQPAQADRLGGRQLPAQRRHGDRD